MKGKNIIAKLFSATAPKAKPQHKAITRYSPLLQNRVHSRYRELSPGEGATYRSVTACIH